MDSYGSIEVDNGHSRRKTKVGSPQEVEWEICFECVFANVQYITLLNAVRSFCGLWKYNMCIC